MSQIDCAEFQQYLQEPVIEQYRKALVEKHDLSADEAIKYIHQQWHDRKILQNGYQQQLQPQQTGIFRLGNQNSYHSRMVQLQEQLQAQPAQQSLSNKKEKNKSNSRSKIQSKNNCKNKNCNTNQNQRNGDYESISKIQSQSERKDGNGENDNINNDDNDNNGNYNDDDIIDDMEPPKRKRARLSAVPVGSSVPIHMKQLDLTGDEALTVVETELNAMLQKKINHGCNCNNSNSNSNDHNYNCNCNNSYGLNEMNNFNDFLVKKESFKQLNRNLNNILQQLDDENKELKLNIEKKQREMKRDKCEKKKLNQEVVNSIERLNDCSSNIARIKKQLEEENQHMNN